jgi:hypothetical protein
LGGDGDEGEGDDGVDDADEEDEVKAGGRGTMEEDGVHSLFRGVPNESLR